MRPVTNSVVITLAMAMLCLLPRTANAQRDGYGINTHYLDGALARKIHEGADFGRDTNASAW